MADKITPISTKTENSMAWSPAGMLQDSIDELESGKRKATKAVVLFLDDSDGQYRVGFSNAGMSASEAVALLEIAKSMFKEEMGY